MHKYLAYGLLLALLLVPQALRAQGGDLLEVADYLELEQVRDAQLSPDGRQVIYTRQWVDRQADRWSSALWIMDADGSRPRFLIDGANARWSPSGDRILFIAEDDHGKPQIFVRWMTGEGAVSQVTRVDVTPSSPHWSPDGSRIAFVAIVPAEDEWQVDLPAAPEGADWAKPPRYVNRLHYRQDGIGYTEPGFMHLFVVPAESGTARQLTSGNWNVGTRFDGLYFGAGLDWMPDGESIVFDGLNDPDGDLTYQQSHIYSIDVASGDIEQLTRDAGYWSEPVVSHDGRRIAYLGYADSQATYEMARIHVMDSGGANARLVAADFDRPASGLLWDDNDRGFYFTAQDLGYVNVFYSSVQGDVRAVTSGRHAISLQSANRATSVGVGIRSSFYEPGEVYSFLLNGRGTPEALTSVNRDFLQGVRLGTQEEIRFAAEDGSRAHGWIVKPPDFDAGRKYPLLLEIHGGPFDMYTGDFDFRNQAFAAAGYVVLYTNPRGSTGYGEAFSQAIDHAYPSVDYLDLMAGVDAVVAEGYIDEKRLYVGGCSGGGVLSSWVISHTDRFAAAAVRCPVINWLSLAGTTDVPLFSYTFFRAPFWEDPSDWLAQSSLMHVGKVNTPTVIMTGEQDMRTPMAQSEEYYTALKMRGVPVRLLRFNDQYHGTGTRPSNYMRTILYMLSWYGRYTLDGEVAAGE